ncbi:hypothetical protein YPPY92_1881, partial [Yersinia pestis PY-92]
MKSRYRRRRRRPSNNHCQH